MTCAGLLEWDPAISEKTVELQVSMTTDHNLLVDARAQLGKTPGQGRRRH
jgi:hypothetical protein